MHHSCLRCSQKFDQWLFYGTFLAIEDKSMFSGNLHEFVQASIVLCIITSMDDNIICNPNYTFASFQDLVHHLLKDVLGKDKAPGETDKSLTSSQCAEHCEEGRFIVKDDT